MGGKGSDNHKATVVGDTVGDPFKDTSGPSLNILIKLMSMVAVVVAGLTVSYAPNIQFYFGFNPSEIRLKEAFSKNMSAGLVKYPSATSTTSSNIGSVIFDEDPLMGTEDILLPEGDETNVSNPVGNKPEVKPAEIKPTEPTTKPAKAFPSGFEAIAPSNTEPAKSEPTTGGFDALVTPAQEIPEGSGGFDSLETDETPADSTGAAATEEPAATEPKADTSDGFGGL